MSKTEQFFSEMASLFLKGDQEAFLELKEDLMEHIAIQLAEGLSEDEILARLGEPSELVEEFYEEQRLHTALVAETDVVAIEDVKEVYLNERKDKVYGIYEQIRWMVLLIISVILGVSGGFSLVYLMVSVVQEHQVSWLALLLMATAGSGLGAIFSSKRERYYKVKTHFFVSFMILLVVTVGSLLTGAFSYRGKDISQVIDTKQADFQSVVVKSDFPMDLITIETEHPTLKMSIKGKGKRKTAALLKEIGQEKRDQLVLDFGQRGLLDVFSEFGPLEVVLYVPTRAKVAEFEIDFENGMVQTQGLKANQIGINLTRGEFKGDDLQGAALNFRSAEADLILNHYAGKVKATSQTGKLIVKNGQGNVELETEKGLIGLIGRGASKASVKSRDGKIVITDTRVSDMTITSQTNAVILENQQGDTQVEILSGKLVANNNQGRLLVNNQAASIIVNQELPLEGELISNSGLVKWVQAAAPITFELSSESGDVVNELEKNQENRQESTYKIMSKTGDIGLYKMVNRN